MRRDKRGRRVGRNWWREYNCALLLDAELSWQLAAEAVCMGYETEMAEYRTDHPRPTLKAFLISNAGIHRETSGL